MTVFELFIAVVGYRSDKAIAGAGLLGDYVVGSEYPVVVLPSVVLVFHFW
ncbi:hypothetical protein GCM10011362_29490 [Marinobacter halophilus]|nr:hypothetical protein GCM10011362_29490 [Marinobacter halophilus]